MKSSKFTYLLVVGLSLTFAVVGCKKKPVYPTTLWGSKVGTPYDQQSMPPTMPIVGGGGAISGPGMGTGIPMGPGHMGYQENATMFEAQTVYFDFDSAVVKTGEKSKIEAVAAHLQSNPAQAVRVEGNCDERGTEEYNRALGERRALGVREALVGLGITPDRVDTISYGEDKPAVPGHTAAAWSKNRRGVFVLLSPPQ
ncbi:MAG TPA: OmpA family protein [Verrucomicrobiae bacterium]|jgi:peptidoglycan-associated lipoprotein